MLSNASLSSKAVAPPSLVVVGNYTQFIEGKLQTNTRYSDVMQSLKLSPASFGLGTVNNVNGEVIIIGKVPFIARPDGVTRLDPDSGAPYAMVCAGSNQSEKQVVNNVDYDAIKELVSTQLKSDVVGVGFHIKGVFETLDFRNETNTDPNKSLEQILKTQQEFKVHDVKGDIVGFMFDNNMAPTTGPGMHAHAVFHDDANTLLGGHVFSVLVRSATLTMQPIKANEIKYIEAKPFDASNSDADDKPAQKLCP